MWEHLEARSLGKKPGIDGSRLWQAKVCTRTQQWWGWILPDFGLLKTRSVRSKFLCLKPEILMKAPAKTNSKLWKVRHREVWFGWWKIWKHCFGGTFWNSRGKVRRWSSCSWAVMLEVFWSKVLLGAWCRAMWCFWSGSSCSLFLFGLAFLLSSYFSMSVEGTRSQKSWASDTTSQTAISEVFLGLISHYHTFLWLFWKHIHNATQSDKKIPVNISVRKWIPHRCRLGIQRIIHTMSKNNLTIVLGVRGLKKELKRSCFHLLGR